MKILLKNILRVLPISSLFITMDILTWKHICDYKGDMGPAFYGFPMIYRTEIPWVNSLSGDFYLLGFLVNLIFFSIIIGLALTFFQKLIKITISKKIRLISWLSIWIICSSFTILNHLLIDWKYTWTHDFNAYIENPSFTCPKETVTFGWNE